MNDRMRRSFDRFKGPFDNMLSRLCQNLDRYILRDHILLDQCTQKLIFCLRRCRKSHFDLLEAYIQKHLEEFYFFLQTHRLDQCLIPIPQIHAAPDGRFFNMVFLHPVIARHRRHKIASFIFFKILHRKHSLYYINLLVFFYFVYTIILFHSIPVTFLITCLDLF